VAAVSHLVIFGLGYTGHAIARHAVECGVRVTATSRSPDTEPTLHGVDILHFDAAGPAVATATHVVSTVPSPGDGGEGQAGGVDPVLAMHGAAIRAAPELRWVGYLSTTGVYGDRQGGWVDEDTPPMPGQERSRRRLAAERAWATMAPRVAVDLFRLAGIYGPGRSALDDVRAGRARRVVKAGHVFGRIHRDDIARAVLAALSQERPPCVRVLNLTDDEPAEASAVVEEAARLLGLDPPPGVPFAEAEPCMSPMARSFWQERRRVANTRTRAALGLECLYPTYREGLRAILAKERSHSAVEQGEVRRS
jgi:nucleoside-diphosphate-sugar epimerase